MMYLKNKMTLLLKTILLITVINSCKKEESADLVLQPIDAIDQGNININFNNTVDEQPIEMSQLIYTNAAGNMYSVNLLKYYVSNITLVKVDNSKIKFNKYELVDAEDATSGNISLGSIEGGIYKSVIFNIGVDSTRNHQGDQTGDLSPQNGMIWTWNTGYIFFKHEGNYMNANLEQDPMVFHYGTDAALATVEVPFPEISIDGNSKTINLAFDLNKLYDSPNTIDFNDDNFIQSTDISDRLWIERVKENFDNAFLFQGVE